MYSDPTKKRTHILKLRLNDEEHELVKRFIEYTGEQPAVVARELLIQSITASLAPGDTT